MPDSLPLGVAYYPEQWPRQRWEEDARLMAGLGLSLVRIGEFAWAELQPAAGTFNPEWLDEAIEVLSAQGLRIVLGTPTAAPPAWLVEAHPEILPVDPSGRRAAFGNRRHYCPNQPTLRAAAEEIVSALAKRYGQRSEVIGWQIDNEFGGRCHCACCREAFAGWLARRYGGLEEVNRAWGTAFWSQTYTAWSQIPLPDASPRAPNPGLALDFLRFTSDSYVRFQRLQADLIRQHSQGQLVTHNLMGFGFDGIDYRELASDLDLVAWDNYPGLQDGHWSAAGLAADAMRGLKGRSTWVMEQQVGAVGWEKVQTPRPGQPRLWTYQAIAHGAEAVLFFRWRTARFGTEQHWHGILDHDGVPRGRHHEVEGLASEVRRLGSALVGLEPLAEVALLHDYPSRFALEVQPTNPALGYRQSVAGHYRALRALGLGVDVVTPDADLARYSLVAAPSLYLMSPELAARLTAYVAAGGTLLLAPRTAAKSLTNEIPERPLPAWLDRLAGLVVRDFQSVPPGVQAGLEPVGGGLAGEFEGWFEDLDLAGAEPLAVYREGPFAGAPAIAWHEQGRGGVLYVGGVATASTLARLYQFLAERLELPWLDLPEALELQRARDAAGGEVVFLLNHSPRPLRAALHAGRWIELGSGTAVSGPVELEGFGSRLLRRLTIEAAEPTAR